MWKKRTISAKLISSPHACCTTYTHPISPYTPIINKNGKVIYHLKVKVDFSGVLNYLIPLLEIMTALPSLSSVETHARSSVSSKCVLFVATDLESAVIKWLCEWWHLLFRLDIQSIPWPWSHGMFLSYSTRDAQSFWLMHRNFTLESPPNLRWLLEWIVGGSLPCCESSSLLSLSWT